MVSAYDSTGYLGDEYASAKLSGNGNTQPYNDNSGNWRFGTVTIVTVASVPEPSTIALLTLAGVAGAIYSFRRKGRFRSLTFRLLHIRFRGRQFLIGGCQIGRNAQFVGLRELGLDLARVAPAPEGWR